MSIGVGLVVSCRIRICWVVMVIVALVVCLGSGPSLVSRRSTNCSSSSEGWRLRMSESCGEDMMVVLSFGDLSVRFKVNFSFYF